METQLTKLEMEAVFQLIQLSSSSDEDFGGVVWMNFPAEKDDEIMKKKDDDQEEASRSAGEALSSTSEKYCFDDDPLPRTNPKFGSLLQIYRNTRPLIKNRAKKRPRF